MGPLDMGLSTKHPCEGPEAAEKLGTFGRQIAASETFRRSKRLRALLLYLCERAVAGHLDELCEQQIGITVFGRVAGHDSANDNVVRVAARQLRLKTARVLRVGSPDD